MKILLTAVGSTGDILPFVALAENLKKAGHIVKVCSYDVYKAKFDKINIPFAAVGPTIDLERVGKVRDSLKKLSPLSQLNYLVDEVFLKDGEKFYQDSVEASRGYHFGVCHSLDFIGQHVMIQNNIPWASVVICPGIIPTAYNSPMNYFNFGQVGNRLAWKMLNRMKAGVEKTIEKYLFELNGIERKINTIGTFSKDVNLVAASAHVGKTYPDLPENFTVTGPWWVPEGHYDPPPHLAEFVRDDKADVVFTFGSMGLSEGMNKKQLFLETAKKAGVRAIIQKGWEGGKEDDLPDNVIMVDYKLPFHYLFRQAKVVVHLGSSGTTIAACKAGAVSVTVPHIVDQRYWASMLKELGVSRKPLSPDKLKAGVLATEIKAALKDQRLHERVQKLSELLDAENGTDVAVKTIEEYVYSIK